MASARLTTRSYVGPDGIQYIVKESNKLFQHETDNQRVNRYYRDLFHSEQKLNDTSLLKQALLRSIATKSVSANSAMDNQEFADEDEFLKQRSLLAQSLAPASAQQSSTRPPIDELMQPRDEFFRADAHEETPPRKTARLNDGVNEKAILNEEQLKAMQWAYGKQAEEKRRMEMALKRREDGIWVGAGVLGAIFAGSFLLKFLGWLTDSSLGSNASLWSRIYSVVTAV